ncbi:hypothetical protein PXH59_09855 [Xenorhabdus sp. SF857]|uniref:hypothetical protein n=1 Tax=Xenorhabdus bakwenae TaxID=3026967 RepID=UPI002557CFC0|nr:hypothetical protein [Xenorhabdus sp. SF857]WFQ81311.1 hypothetical protein PXH59_09855 [Xenorhabdus sp. SF857]
MNRLIGAKSYLQSALELNEEMQAVLLPLLKVVENEASADTHAMLRAVRTLSMNQYRDINELDCILDAVIETKKTSSNLKIELEPARNAIESSRVLISNLIDAGEDNDTTTALVIISEYIIAAGQEIARVRGVE